MNKRIILKLEQDGKDFGYVKLKKDIFYSNGSKEEAVVFELENYKKSSDSFYYKVADTKDSYMDVKAATSRVQVVKPFLSVSSSSICAWTLKNGILRMVLASKETGKALSTSEDAESTALYANLFDGKPFTVIEENPKEASNKANPALAHVII
ncbi:hypothetical protein NH341_11345 [Tenacibaculum sp. XPcli2-G]|uniref:hypothetical protein n=1 Tax=Tenacibaculum sp. XPcli2-G TaxID=2954503 RepID=UPI0020974C84|nr:hypothetical protein [Tenacibaculum sp. XPcli2-G]MCO7186025.1 hypothetical protein [Tenacibaculum sp. XPcli2-G]BFF40379.1 hypothetical protein BACY1_21840 [Tenacibaculum mesophilum]